MAASAPPIAVLTRPEGRNEPLARRLAGAGWQVLTLPALAIDPLPDEGHMPLPQEFGLVIFVSGNAASLYLERLAGRMPGQSWPAGTLAATVGPASARVLRDSPLWCADATVLHPPAGAESHDSETLWNLLSRRPLPRRALLVRGTQGRDWLADRLTQAGVEVVRHALYRRRPADWSGQAERQLSQWASQAPAARPVWLLTSAEGISAVAEGLRVRGLLGWWGQCRFVVTHPRLVQHLLAVAGGSVQTGMVKVSLPADEAIFEALTRAV